MYSTQNQLLLNNLISYYQENDRIDKILPIINGTTQLSIRIIDWFVTNYSKKYYTVYYIEESTKTRRFKVYNDYKLKLRAYSKRRFDPFCRWDRIHIPYKDGQLIQTTIGQLNFFKWALDNKILEYIQENMKDIEIDMNKRNSSSRKKDRMNKSNSSISSMDSEDMNYQITNTVNEEMVDLNMKTATEINTKYLKSKLNENKTRKKREELSTSAARSIKKESVDIEISFQ